MRYGKYFDEGGDDTAETAAIAGIGVLFRPLALFTDTCLFATCLLMLELKYVVRYSEIEVWFLNLILSTGSPVDAASCSCSYAASTSGFL